MLKRNKTWKVLRWDNPPDEQKMISLSCRHCGTDADIPIGPTPGGMVIAALGLNLIFDPPGYNPPENFMPTEIRCRTCRHEFTNEKESSDVR